MNFRYLEKVVVKTGFYRGYNGIIKNVEKQKDESYKYNVDLSVNDKTINVNFSETELKKVWF